MRWRSGLVWSVCVVWAACDDGGDSAATGVVAATPQAYDCASAQDQSEAFGVKTFIADHPKGCCDADGTLFLAWGGSDAAIDIGADDCTDPDCSDGACTRVCTWFESAGRYGCSDAAMPTEDPSGDHPRACKFPVAATCGSADAPVEITQGAGGNGAGGTVDPSGSGPTSGNGGSGGQVAGSGGSGGQLAGSGGAPGGGGASPGGGGSGGS